MIEGTELSDFRSQQNEHAFVGILDIIIIYNLWADSSSEHFGHEKAGGRLIFLHGFF